MPVGHPFRRSNRIQIRNLPPQTNKEDIEQLVGTFGTIQRCELGRFVCLLLCLILAALLWIINVPNEHASSASSSLCGLNLAIITSFAIKIVPSSLDGIDVPMYQLK